MLIRVFNSQGQLVGPFESSKVVKSEQEWQQQLTPEQYRITRNQGTEPPFCGTLLDNKKAGVYTCVCCGLPLFSSLNKFDSGTGWPSFFQPIAPENVRSKQDRSHGMVRTEILCARCDAHLGHVFDDGPRPTGLRFCLNSESLAFTAEDQLASLADPLSAATNNVTAASGDLAIAVFAGGCFWCTEAVFEPVPGVVSVESGYAGGTAETANYEAVCSGTTNHAEAVRITYDPAKVSYARLLELFFTLAHDPTQLNRQGPDTGRQYRSAVFYASEQEKQQVQAFIRKLEQDQVFSKPIVTTLEPLTQFYLAEKYHQDYARQNPNQPYIRLNAAPKVEKLKKKLGEEAVREN